MRLHFQEKPLDLYGAVGYTAVMAVVLVAFNVGNFLAILVVLFVPGYVLVAALFPTAGAEGKIEIDWIERIALSFGLSVGVVPLLGLLLNFTPWGIRFVPIVVTIALYTAGVGYAAYWRRVKLPPKLRLHLTIDLTLAQWKEYTMLDKGLAIALASSVVGAASLLAFIVLTPRPSETFTEFYLLGPGGSASGYPMALNVSQPETVILGLANHEAANENYTVRIDLVGVQIVYNATSRFNETIEVNRTAWWASFNKTLADGQNWTQPYTFRISFAGLWKVLFLLFKDNDFSSTYRSLQLFVRVT